jgi:16S rRNA processing protein RimM
MPAEWIAIAVIRRPVGLEGVCGIQPFGATFAGLEPPVPVKIGDDSAGAQDAVLCEILERPGGFQCRFEGKTDRTSVEGLRGKQLFVTDDLVPKTGANEFYHHELMGMAVHGSDGGGLLGTVIEVHNFPAGDTVEVALARGGTILVPLSSQAIAAIDTKAKKCTVHERFIEELLQ